jgi:ADP-heptose:LPS heptosyltransferase
LTAAPALRALRDAFPHNCTVMACPPELAPIARLTGSVDAVLPASPLAPLTGATERPSIAVNLHGRGPESHRILLAHRPRRLIAFAHPSVPESEGMPRWRADEHEVDRWCRLLHEHGIEVDSRRLALEASSSTLPVPAGATVVHPGAASEARRWPAERFAQVAASERRAGRVVLITGSSAERPLAEHVAGLARLPRASVIAGETSLLELAGVVSVAGCVVCGDTGIGHLATALGTPSVLLFGPTSPSRWGPPLRLRDRHRVLWAGTEGDPHATEVFQGLLAINASDVIDELADLRRRG